MNADHVYLDFQASTPADPAVLDAMSRWSSAPANPHASNAAGRAAANAIETARGQVAALIGAKPSEVTFTANATEAANIALRSFGRPGARIWASAIEHACVRDTLAALESVETVTIPVDADGLVDPDAFEEQVTAHAAMVVVMAVNNEIGTIQPVAEIGRICGFLDVPFFSDLAQATGRIPIDVAAMGVDLAALSSHKMYGPQGIGALYCREDLRPRLRPLATGGGQERGLRPGTLPTALCVGFGHACVMAGAAMAEERERARSLAETFMTTIRAEVPNATINGSQTDRVPHNLNIAFPGIDADALLALVPSLSASTGSACSSGALAPSHVLAAIGLDERHMSGSVRIGFGRTTTSDDVERAARMMTAAVAALRVAPTRRRVGGERA